MDADGLALLFWMGVLALVLLVLAGTFERIFARPSRRWIKRLRDLERARLDWQARVIETQHFWKE